MIHLEIFWHYEAGEGRLNKVDTRAIRKMASGPLGDRLTALDFLIDARYEVDRLYNSILAGGPKKRGKARRKPKGEAGA